MLEVLINRKLDKLALCQITPKQNDPKIKINNIMLCNNNILIVLNFHQNTESRANICI